jgi:hypothetical protein
MPRIPVYTAEVKPRTPNVPMSISPQDTTGQRVAQQGQELADRWVQILHRLQAQQGDLEWLQARADREAGIENIKQDLARDPKVIDDPSIYEAEYTQRVDQLENNVRSQLRTERGAFQFDVHTERERKGELAKARGEGLKLFENKIQSQFIVERARLSRQAGEASTPAEYRANVELFGDQVKKMHDRGLFSDAQAEEQQIVFRQETAKNNMRFIGSVDPVKMHIMRQEGVWDLPEAVKLQISEHVAAQQRTLLNEKKELETELQRLYLNDINAQANNGTLAAWKIKRGQDGQDPLHPNSADWNRIYKLNEEAPAANTSDSGGMLQKIAAIRYSHSLREPTIEDSRLALSEIELLTSGGGLSKHAQEEATKAADHFQSHIKAIKAIELANEKYRTSQEHIKQTDIRVERNDAEVQKRRKLDDALIQWDHEAGKRAPGGTSQMAARFERDLANKKAIFKDYMNRNPGADVGETIKRILGSTTEQQSQEIDRMEKLRKSLGK